MFTNNQEDILKKITNLYKQGKLSQYLPGTNITFTDNGCNIKTINASGGEGSGSASIITTTYDELSTIYNNGELVTGQFYRFPFQNIYDQGITEDTKTSSVEWLVVQALSPTLLTPNVVSESFPTDDIIYDISIVQTRINNAPTMGRIIYRRDTNGNIADFDFRTTLMWDEFDSAEHLLFNFTKANTGNNLGNNYALFQVDPFFGGYEFPNTVVIGKAVNNMNNLLLNCHFGKDFYFNSGCILADFSVGTGDCSKIFGTNIYQVIIDGSIDRMVGGAILFSHFGGLVHYIDGSYLEIVDIEGDVRGLSDITIKNTTINCNLSNVNSTSGLDSESGLDGCTITGDLISSTFGNITIQGAIQNKTITETDHPILFSRVYKTMFVNEDSEVWYFYYDTTNTQVFIEII